jgi:hypothetical protein
LKKIYHMIIQLIFGLLTYLLPALVLYFIARMVVGAYLGNEGQKREAAIKAGNRDTTLPLRLQAYERLTLLLERISPQQAINRVMQPGLSATQFQVLLTQNIREEFEHNAAQQVYISQQGWVLIRSAKEEVIRLINTASSETGSRATASELALLIMEKSLEWEQNPFQAAMEQLKKEAEGLF